MTKVALLSATTALALTMPFAAAQAQETAPDASAATESPEAPAEILVTGSRISRPGLSSNSPIVSMTGEAFKATGAVTLESTLNQLPELVPANGATNNDGLTGGITTLDLRGLGSNRTLVLQDARRLQSATALGSVDINLIPAALIENVEIITGGASAAYGSDAIAGVVNFKLNHRFTGLALDAQNGVTERGDGFTTKASLTGGLKFGGGRGHAQFSVSYAKRNGVANADRDFSSVVRPSSTLTTGAYVANAANLPTQAAIDSVFGSYGVAPGSVGASRNLSFNGDGTLFSYQTNAFNVRTSGPGLLVGPSSVRYNSSGVAGLTIPFERFGGYGYVDYEISDAAKLYVEGNYQHVTSSAYYAPGFMTVSVPVTNPFISADLAKILASRPNPTANFSVSRRFGEVGFRIADTTTDSGQVRVGGKGELGIRDWTWDVYGSYGRTESNKKQLNGFSVSALTSLASAPDGGASLCAGGLNLFGLQANSTCANYIRRNAQQNSISEQAIAEATVQGGLFALPAGEVRFALGVDYRSDHFSSEPDAALQSGDIVSFDSGAIPPVRGTIRAREAYGELSIPLLADLPMIHRLSVNLGMRYSHYSRFGGIFSYRGEGTWEITNGLRLRGGYARAVRAPSIAELYTPTSTTSPSIGLAGSNGQGDPCDVRGAYRNGANAAQVRQLCIAQGLPANIADTFTFNTAQITEGGTTGGNLKLRPEVADTFTAGAVITPDLDRSWISRLSLSVDFYNIKLKKAVGLIDGLVAVQKCYNFDGSNPDYSPTNIYCSLFGRSAASGEINSFALYNLNLGSITTSGIDIAADWGIDLAAINAPGGGGLNLSGTATWLRNYKVQTLPGETPTNYAGTAGYTDQTSTKALPRWKASASAVYTNGPATIGLQYRYIGPMTDSSVVGQADTTGFDIGSRSYFDLNLNLKAAHNFDLRFGVTNLTDRRPPIVSSFEQSNTMPTVYDVLGRSFYAGVSVRM